jgi:tRNA threonylcarbamoyladenosine biosynthesis protein TsaE
MSPPLATMTLFLPEPDATTHLACLLADHLPRGACILLSGPIGAGKSHFARAFIRHRLGYCGDIPSPTFTLVQTYESPEETIWHADLYRLSHPDEVAELGLEAALGQAICLIEWPDRLGRMAPKSAISLTFRTSGDGRNVEITGADAALMADLAHV